MNNVFARLGLMKNKNQEGQVDTTMKNDLI